MKRKKTVLKQFIVSITFFIVFIEGAILFASYHETRNKLYRNRGILEREVLANTSMSLKEVHPEYLSDAYIEKELESYALNIIGLIAIIILFVVTGFVGIYHFLAGRHLKKLHGLIQGATDENFNLYPENEIPNNDIGEIIAARNRTLQKIASYQENIQRQLVHSAKLSSIGEMTSTIAHDLKNPLSVIRAQLDLVKLKKEKDKLKTSDYEKLHEKVELSYERLARLVMKINNKARADFSEKSEIIFSKIIEDSLILIESKIKRNSVELQLDVEDIAGLNGDPSSLEQVFMNLISNSIDAMEEVDKRVLKIYTRKTSHKCVLYFEDSGPGVPLELQGKIFESFFSTKGENLGTGLGLAICREILKKNGATIHVDPDFEKGARFVIEFEAQDIKLAS